MDGAPRKKRRRGGRRGGSKHKPKHPKPDGEHSQPTPRGDGWGGWSSPPANNSAPSPSPGGGGGSKKAWQKHGAQTKGYKPRAKVAPEIVTANNEISQHAQRKQLAEAAARFEALGELKNSHSYAAIVNAHVRCGDVAGAAERVLAMKAAGLRPCVVTYTSLIKGYCAEGRLGEAEAVLREMEAAKPKVLPNVRTANTMLRGCLLTGDVPRALQIFKRMPKSWNLQPDSR